MTETQEEETFEVAIAGWWVGEPLIATGRPAVVFCWLAGCERRRWEE